VCPDTREAIPVLAAVIERNSRFLITRRLEGSHLSGFWEFPGGKCDAGETHEACLARELREELGVEAHVGDELIVTEHAYSDRTVRLYFRRCKITGEPRPLLDQEIRWVSREEMRTLAFPDADRALIETLTRAEGKGQRAKERSKE
jgi:mutator protein MutT